MQLIYGCCRISKKKQNIGRQVCNILAVYPTARIVKEIYTGTKICRRGLDRILSKVQSGDTMEPLNDMQYAVAKICRKTFYKYVKEIECDNF